MLSNVSVLRQFSSYSKRLKETFSNIRHSTERG